MPDLVDRIYECAFAPERWPAVCDELASIAGARGAFLFTANDRVVHWTSSHAVRDGVARFVAGDFYHRSPRAARAIAARHAGFLSERDIYREEELATDPLYRDLLWPAGLGHCAGMVVTTPTGDELFVSMERERAKGPVEAGAIAVLDGLRPHLARAALMGARLRLERAKAAGEALAALGIPALVFDATGIVLAANDLIDSLSHVLRWRSQDRLSLVDATANRQWQQAIETLAQDTLVAPLSFAVRAVDASAALVAHVVPVRLEVRDLFARATGVLVLSPVSLPQAPPVELVQSLFDLTPAEARVARHLASGLSVDEIAVTGDVSVATVRTQVRGVLEKTGSRRQAEAVALLTGVHALRR
jgi:DNA-binding CsgD family transcriptional regulator